ncbi:flagellar basal body rod protein FlgB [Aliarcobacter skirrowii]|jgi:flagellar basal-body rod protein FlgB|uniref:Flagellar basal body rod protein FlgB n=1 Tax=Aliarcobacter skirrowii CCUG 10374 TaxID=1032239 RepID=A0AAD0SMD0_9BACT|nr:flagellar basal body rod protein FlgB [Aliarcobacter skirrowii]AXX85459.1 flagellar proximal rod protein FlgB [Aliarcobacter skirrowii CCUG 10374]KAB0621132.1 flagellar basal body rod protein FlgB [Aliarcobacter skirrowii CCUG 10374]MDX4038714.1 flagellar basal body rod protein FlgB [Aliarcobacter skirrowii]RXI26303.1 flagellar basal body rod protein FlgB [Aliarcobacter skirrowii CCUG 10374]SUU96006.1 Flagellar basal body rod protein FlgB [Aliarcobacter skirrowii]
MHASNVSAKLFEQLNFRGERQKVISSNIANINTPNYKTKDLVFEDELKQQQLIQMTRTSSMHMQNIDYKPNSNPRLIQVPDLIEQNDGNNVNLDSQISEQSKNKIIFDAIQTSIKRDSKLFRSVIDSSGKN